MLGVIKKILGDPQAKTLKTLTKRADIIDGLSPGVKKLSDSEIKARIDKIKEELTKNPDKLDDHLNETFALIREASQRTIGMEHFKVQLVGGLALHLGNVAEMRTGEGKTLVATLPIGLNAMTGLGTHLVTVNDYLAQRDAGWNGPLYDFLGLSVGVIIPYESYIYDPKFTNEDHDDERFRHLRPCSRQEAYGADITYGTNNEFGFDYLRDNMVRSAEELRQRELNYAIVDEVDSILIDEARTPLIISAPAAQSGDMYRVFAKSVRDLTPQDYELDEKQRSVILNDQGVEKMQKRLGLDNLYDPANIQQLYHLEQALRAETLFKLDKDYVVREGEVIIVDEFTGRLMIGRRYSEGLHQAIEAKEGVEVQQESMTLATISFQNYFRLYKKLSGMTGTALTEAEEFHTIYGLDVISVPTNKQSIREDLTDRIYKSEQGKYNSIVREISERTGRGQPVLIGTASVEKNEKLSRLLTKAGIAHELLNAKNNEREAAIVAGAGQKGAVTLATNIAGRGTDIVLGEGVVKLGGLHVIGSERHESRRIDNQLRGRCGRQGDPGSTQFYVSVEDDLMRIFGGEKVKSLMEFLKVDEETPIEQKSVTKVLETAQKKVESHNFDIRKNLVSYDDVMNRHRKAIYARRRQILLDKNVVELVENNIQEETELIARASASADKKLLIEEAAQLFDLSETDKKALSKTDELHASLVELAKKSRSSRNKKFGREIMHRIEREVFLQVLDELWMQHLESMQHLREGIGWRSVGQRDPLVEYRREGQIFFDAMEANLRTTALRLIFHVSPQVIETAPEQVDTALTKAAQRSSEGSGELQDGSRRARRNSPQSNQKGGDETPKPKERLKSKRQKKSKKKKRR